MIYIALFGNCFIMVFLKAWQQQNVIHRQYYWVMPTSIALAFVEVYMIFTVAHRGFGPIIIPIALGSALGCMVSMWLHDRVLNRKK